MKSELEARGALIASKWDWQGVPLECKFLMHDEMEYLVSEASIAADFLSHCGAIVDIQADMISENEIAINHFKRVGF